MSKKVDLNAPRNSQNDYKKSRNNHSFSHKRPISNEPNDSVAPTKENSNTKNNTMNEKSLSRKTSRGFGVAGLSRGMTENVGSMDASDKIKLVIKFIPPTVKVVVLAIIAIPLVGLMLFAVLFSNAGASDISDYIALAELCSTITVTDTDCDADGNNCTHKYDGEVDFEDYIAGLVAGIADGANNLEFYKALSTALRSNIFSNLGEDCIASGNDSSMPYKDINNANDKNLILSAVKDTKANVLVNEDDELVLTDYSMACVVNNDNGLYYVRYGNDNYQTIDVDWDSKEHIFSGQLAALYNDVDKSSENYERRNCPDGNSDSGLSLIGALYLATDGGYKDNEILDYYYGDVNFMKAEGTFVGNQVNGFINPVSTFSMCTSSYGCRLHPVTGAYRYHNGIDIPVVEGTTVYATKDGIITNVQSGVHGYLANSYGNYIDINHGDGTMTRYAHLKYGGISGSVYYGAKVVQGQAIALSGNTGTSTGPHLHYEVHVNGASTDPYYYLDLSVINNSDSCNFGKSVPSSYCGR